MSIRESIPFEIAVVTSVYRRYALKDALSLASHAGYRYVDIWGGRPHAYRHDYSGSELREIAQLMVDLGLTASSFFPHFYGSPYSLIAPNAKARKDAVDYVKECIDNARALGCSSVLVCADRLLEHHDRDTAIAHFGESLVSLDSYACQASLKLALEPVWNEIFDIVHDTSDALSVIERFGLGCTGIAVDTGHTLLNGREYHQEIAKAYSRIVQVHLDDTDGTSHTGAIPGTGCFDFKGFFDCLVEFGYTGVLSVELGNSYWREPGEATRRAREWVQTSLDARS